MVNYKDFQVYFQASGDISIFRGRSKYLSPEEKFKSVVETEGVQIRNFSRGVQIQDSSLFFIGLSGNVCRFDMLLISRANDQKKIFRAENLPTGTVVDFVALTKNKLVSLSSQGVITLVESYRAVKQTPKLSQEEVHTCIGEIDSKLLVSSFSPALKRNNFKLINEDFRESYLHVLDNEGRRV